MKARKKAAPKPPRRPAVKRPAAGSKTLGAMGDRFLHDVVNSIGDPIFVKDARHRWILLNDAACDVMGRPREELIGKSDYDIFPREQADVFWKIDNLVLKTGKPNLNEEQITWKGKIRTVTTKKSIFKDPVSGEKFIVGTIRDITRRSRIERALEKSRRTMEKRVMERTAALTAANKRLRAEIRDRRRAEKELARRGKLEAALSRLRERLLQPASLPEKLLWITKTVIAIFKADFCRIWIIRPGDICDRCMHKSVTKAKVIVEPESEKFIEMVGNGLHDCIYRDKCLHLVASAGRYTHTDGTVHRRIPFGCYKIGRVAAGINHKFLTNDVQSDPRVHDHAWARTLGLRSFAGYRLTSPEGAPLGVMGLFSTREISPEEDTLLQDLASTASHVIQGENAKEALRKSEEQYRNLYETALVGLFRTRIEDGRILKVNKAGARILGYGDPDDLLRDGVTASDFYPPERRTDLLRQLKEKGEISDFEVHWMLPDGRGIDITISAKIYPGKGYIEGVVIDITERRRLEEQLRQAQKLEAVGMLAGGIAHDFNNILAGMLGYASLVRDQLGEENPLTADIDSINELGWRGADLTRALLAFARKGAFHPEPLAANRIIANVLKLVERTAGKNITIKKKLPAGIMNVLGDRGQIHQVIMNLCINACEAMPQGGVLTVQTKNCEKSEQFFAQNLSLEKGRCVEISVRDTGEGMEKDVIDRIFDPFFTTKDERTGTGLGLSVVGGIVERHGGYIEVESFPGEGSTFRIYLPATERAEQALPAEGVSAEGGDETVMVVDDEKDFRETAGRWLEGLGYSVIKAESGEKALEIIAKKKGAVDLVLLDVIMRGMGGVEAFKIMRKKAPGLPVIVCSGFSLDTTYKHILKDKANGFLQKPFKKETLALKVRQALDARGEKGRKKRRGK